MFNKNLPNINRQTYLSSGTKIAKSKKIYSLQRIINKKKRECARDGHTLFFIHYID